MYDGPIKFAGKGAGPKVEERSLVEWWNGLEAYWEEVSQRESDQRATVDERYQHGKDSTIFPGISGHDRKRKKTPKD